jgi:hypothetical protein
MQLKRLDRFILHSKLGSHLGSELVLLQLRCPLKLASFELGLSGSAHVSSLESTELLLGVTDSLIQ